MKLLTQPLNTNIKKVIGILLLLPVFFQINNGLFRSTELNFSSGGVLANLPIPISVIACYMGIILLGKYKQAHLSLSVIFFTFVLMVMTTVITSGSDPTYQQAKLILLFQFILPMFALVLGQVYDCAESKDEKLFERMFLYVLAVLVPWQLIATWYREISCLHPSLGIFSIYQYLQYVPLVFVSAYLIAMFSLWRDSSNRLLLLLLAPIMGIYVAASMSLLAVGLLFLGMASFCVYLLNKPRKYPIAVFILSAALSASYIHYGKVIFPNIQCGLTNKFVSPQEAHTPSKLEVTPALQQEEKQLQDKVPVNLGERITYWKYYWQQITSSSNALMMGHAHSPKRDEYPSAHNYYLDFIYNFGLLALIPLVFLLIRTCRLTYLRRHEILLSPALLGLGAVVIFLLLVDNSLKVSLRQPYPGIFTFFIWGVLLSRLSAVSISKAANET